MSRARNRGMSIVELMVVVVIIGILAAISVVSYRRYIARARMSEVTAMLAEFAAKEQIYFLDAGMFLEARRDSTTAGSEAADGFYPSRPDAYFDSARTPVALGTLPTTWKTLGIRPRWQELYCTYLVNAGAPNVAPPSPIGAGLWSGTPKVAWFYAMGACNLSGEAGWSPGESTQYVGWSDNVTVSVLTHDSPALRTHDEVR
jgi:prepilin-type N-terminal cleavage/methylation domain-containing protein